MVSNPFAFCLHYFTPFKGCQKMIIGARFKVHTLLYCIVRELIDFRFQCMHPECPDYDLCECCEALPNSVHPPTHPMLKMNTADTVIPTVYRVGATDLIKPVSERSPSRNLRDLGKAEDDQVETPTFPRASLDFVLGFPPLGVPLSPVTTLSEVPSSSARSKTPVGKRSLPPIPAGVWQLATDGITAPKVTETPYHQASQSTIEEPSTVTTEYLPPPRFTLNDELRDVFARFDWKSTSSKQDVSHPVAPEADSMKSLPCGDTNRLRSPSPSEYPRLVTPCSPAMAAIGVSASEQGTQQVESGALDLSALVQSLILQDAGVDQNSGLAKDALSAILVEDSISGGQVFPPGAEFVKSWRILNNGEIDWPIETELVLVSGEELCAHEISVKVGAVAKGAEINICTTELKVRILFINLAFY
jgi:next-to-BRCA1 protein 1